MKRDIEIALALHACRPALFVAPVLALVFGIVRGPAAAWAAAVGVAIVAGNLLLSGALLSLVVRRWPMLLTGAALLSFVLRLLLVTVALALLQQATGMDRPAAVVSAVVAYVVMLIWEVVAVARGWQGEPGWSR